MAVVQPIVTTLKSEMKELKSKYCALYELKMQSQIEDVDPKFSLAAIASVEKAEHAIKMEKQKA